MLRRRELSYEVAHPGKQFGSPFFRGFRERSACSHRWDSLSELRNLQQSQARSKRPQMLLAANTSSRMLRYVGDFTRRVIAAAVPIKATRSREHRSR